MSPLNGLLRCSRYAFGPNRLHYCGPNASAQLAGHIKENVADLGLREILSQFETMAPYLRLIAHANHIADPFDERVVDAYWLGNRLLDSVAPHALFAHLSDKLDLRKKLPDSDLRILREIVREKGTPSHAFHVFSIWTKSRRDKADGEIVTALNECRVSWGKIINFDGPRITVETDRIVCAPNGDLLRIKKDTRIITRPLDATEEIDLLEIGDTTTIHWGVPCEAIPKNRTKDIDSATDSAIEILNRNHLI